MLRSVFRAFRARVRSPSAAVVTRSNAQDPARALYRRAVAALPARQREIFQLHRVAGLTIAEIAQRLGMPSPEVEREFADALLAIARTIEPQP